LLFFRPPFAIVIRDRRGVWRFTVAVTAVCLAYAEAATVATDWAETSSLAVLAVDLAVSAFGALILALPLAYYAARSNLALYQAKCQAERASLTDSLTGLMNRRAFMRLAENESGEPLALVVFDLDHFKRVNDLHGHQAGDAVIRRVAEALRSGLGGFGQVARVGGEEFALLAAPSAYAELIAALTDLRAQIAATPVVIDGQTIAVTLSAGLALGGPGESFSSLYRRADRALYAAKTAGRNCLRVNAGPAPAGPDEAPKASLSA